MNRAVIVLWTATLLLASVALGWWIFGSRQPDSAAAGALTEPDSQRDNQNSPAAATTGSVAQGEFLREQRAVAVGGTTETWQLIWTGRPESICGPDEPEAAITCPCSGFAYGEMGKLDLVRKRNGRQIDRMALGPLFTETELFADNSEGLAAMQWRPMQDRDWKDGGRQDSAFLAEVRSRPGPRVMRPADYDNDGVESEFLVQVDTLPCGKHQFAAVGVSKANPRLHAFSSSANPSKPLTMPEHIWRSLLERRSLGWLSVWECDDHGSEAHWDMQAVSSGGKITVRQRSIGCDSHGNAGKLLSNVAV